MKNIVLISCSSRKSKSICTAQKMYKGSLFMHSLKFAQSLKPEAIYILSAKHGLLKLNDVISPYNVSITDLGNVEIKEWAQKVLSDLSRFSSVTRDQFIILAGKNYIDPLRYGITNLLDLLEGLNYIDRVKILKAQYDVT